MKGKKNGNTFPADEQGENGDQDEPGLEHEPEKNEGQQGGDKDGETQTDEGDQPPFPGIEIGGETGQQEGHGRQDVQNQEDDLCYALVGGRHSLSRCTNVKRFSAAWNCSGF